MLVHWADCKSADGRHARFDSWTVHVDDAQWLRTLGDSEVVYLNANSCWQMIEFWEEVSSPDCEPETKSWVYTRHYAKLVRVTAMPPYFNPNQEVRHEP